MKKFFSILLTVALITALSATAFAEDAQEITVSYTASEAYVVTIPSSQALSAGSLSSTGTVSANVLLKAGDVLKVFMNSANGFALKCGESAIAYSVEKDGAVLENDACVLEVAAGSTSGEKELTFATTEQAVAAATIAGEHTDVITFSCSLIAAE